MKKISLAVMTVFSLNFYSDLAPINYGIGNSYTPLNDSDMFCDSTCMESLLRCVGIVSYFIYNKLGNLENIEKTINSLGRNVKVLNALLNGNLTDLMKGMNDTRTDITGLTESVDGVNTTMIGGFQGLERFVSNSTLQIINDIKQYINGINVLFNGNLTDIMKGMNATRTDITGLTESVDGVNTTMIGGFQGLGGLVSNSTLQIIDALGRNVNVLSALLNGNLTDIMKGMNATRTGMDDGFTSVGDKITGLGGNVVNLNATMMTRFLKNEEEVNKLKGTADTINKNLNDLLKNRLPYIKDSIDGIKKDTNDINTSILSNFKTMKDSNANMEGMLIKLLKESEEKTAMLEKNIFVRLGNTLGSFYDNIAQCFYSGISYVKSGAEYVCTAIITHPYIATGIVVGGVTLASAYFIYNRFYKKSSAKEVKQSANDESIVKMPVESKLIAGEKDAGDFICIHR